MENRIQNYIGCPCIIGRGNVLEELKGVLFHESGAVSVTTGGLNRDGRPIWYDLSSCKLVLKPMYLLKESKIPEEMQIFDVIESQLHEKCPIEFISGNINSLRAFSYDCDGLIESGLAHDRTKI